MRECGVGGPPGAKEAGKDIATLTDFLLAIIRDLKIFKRQQFSHCEFMSFIVLPHVSPKDHSAHPQWAMLRRNQALTEKLAMSSKRTERKPRAWATSPHSSVTKGTCQMFQRHCRDTASQKTLTPLTDVYVDIKVQCWREAVIWA